ncbi:MAG: transposase [bacterium]|nr:transposase [bacterium]
MPRKARIDAPGALHHIIVRGVERKAIFKDNADRDNFVERLGQIISETDTGCYAWVLMKNHVHMLLKTGLAPIVTVMRRLLTGYAVSFNRRHLRHGHLFQNRYKSFLCEEDLYLKELVRYIHLNPLRAKVVKDIKDLGIYRWCGHSALMGKAEADFQDTEYVFKSFGRSVRQARRAYESFVAKGIKHGRRPDLVGGGLLRSVGGWAELKEFRDLGIRIKGDERLLGSFDFVEKVLKQADEQLEEKYRLKVSVISLQGLIEKVARYYKIDPKNLKSASKERTITEARRVLCYIAVRKLGYKCSDVSKAMGISAVTVSRAVSLGSELSGTGKIQKLILDN